METETPSGTRVRERVFCPANGPSVFFSPKRDSQGHVNSAYEKQKDNEDDTDDNISTDPECNSTGTEMSEYFDEEEGISAPENDSQRKEPWEQFPDSNEDKVLYTDIKFWDTVYVVTKLVVAFLLFFCTLGTAVITKICFIIITANIFPKLPVNDSTTIDKLKTLNGTLFYKNTHTNVQWIWALIMMSGAPYVFICCKSLWRMLSQMAQRGSPSWCDILGIFSIETIHSVGLNVMIFVVIPAMDPISGLLYTLCVGVIPSVMKIFYPTVGPSLLRHNEDRSSITTSLHITLIGIIGALGQLAALALWAYHVHSVLNESSSSIPYLMCLFFAPIFTSVYWWENYVHEGRKKESSGIPQLARHMRKNRTKLMFYASVWKLLITLVVPIAIYGISCDSKSNNCTNTMYFKHDKAMLNSKTGTVNLVSDSLFGECNSYLPLIVASVGILCSGVCFKVGKVACKIMTQIVDYSIPLVISTPTTIGLILGMYAGVVTTKQVGCNIPFPEWAQNKDSADYFGQLMAEINIWFPVLAGLSGFISLLLVTNHVWTPGQERLQRTDKLFVQPLYCGIFLDQSLLLNRRRIEKTNSADIVKIKVAKMPIPDMMDEDEESISPFMHADTPMIYLCATMWHESENEMIQLLKSIFRMDEDHSTRTNAQTFTRERGPDYYEFEAHIFFDDAFEGHTEDVHDFKVNEYVKLLLKCVPPSASAIYDKNYKINPPVTVATPYGGRLIWTMRGGNQLIAHLKDKTFIRHRKRWSQVMYMYYFLGYDLSSKGLKPSTLQKRAENTFLLALDGDVDFHPRAVSLLVDRMRKNLDVGAACGRIHPIGNGAMVWYQKFEYAVSHWLQKAAEDKFGCVLCSPGCFSLFRGSSLMDENVMVKYTTPPSEPRHYVQYDQGEDRWLCTLLLQNGQRVEYCAASDALTYAPEGFYEFFNQRRRWTPSTMANIMDLLTDWKNVTKKNAEISLAYIFYQGLLMVSSILTPGTIFLMILGAINLAYPSIELWQALLINLLPIAVMVLLCFKAKTDTQLLYAAILSTAYSLIMMIVIVGLLKQAAEFGFESITTVFLLFVAGVFVISALIHPQEFWCIIHGFLYFLAIPSMSMILMLYALGNLHVVSWGTRENKSAAEQQVENKKKEGRLSGIISMFAGCCPWGDLFSHKEDEKLRIILERLDGIENGPRVLNIAESIGSGRTSSHQAKSGTSIEMGNEEPKVPFAQLTPLFSKDGKKDNPVYEEEEKQLTRDRLRNPYWMCEDDEMRDLQHTSIDSNETVFWWKLIEKYLKPLDEDKNKQVETQAGLIELRNKVCLIFILINSLFIIVVFSLQQVVQDSDSLALKLPWVESDSVENGQKIEPISVAFTLVFGVLLFVQFICMLMHRMATLLHICAATEIFKKKQKVESEHMSWDQIYELVRDMQKDPEDDSASLISESSVGGQSDIDEDEDKAQRRKEAKERWKRCATKKHTIHENTLAENFRTNLVKVQAVIKQDSRADDERSEEISEEEIKTIKKEGHFNMRRNSIKVIAMMSRDPKLKANIANIDITKEAKKEVGRSKWKQVLNKQDGMLTSGRTPKFSVDTVNCIRRGSSKEATLQTIQEISQSSPDVQRNYIQIHREDSGPEYTNINDVHNKADDVSDKPPSPIEQRYLSTESDTVVNVQPQLVIPRVEDKYVVAQETVDVLF